MYIYICMYVCIYIYICVYYMYIYICIYVYIYIYIYILVYISILYIGYRTYIYHMFVNIYQKNNWPCRVLDGWAFHLNGSLWWNRYIPDGQLPIFQCWLSILGSCWISIFWWLSLKLTKTSGERLVAGCTFISDAETLFFFHWLINDKIEVFFWSVDVNSANHWCFLFDASTKSSTSVAYFRPSPRRIQSAAQIISWRRVGRVHAPILISISLWGKYGNHMVIWYKMMINW